VQRQSHRHRHRATSLAGLLALALGCGAVVPPSPAREADLDFGRFSERLVRCSFSTPGDQRTLRSCGKVRIEQNLSGVLSVRFSLNAASGSSSGQQLVFAGLLSEGSEPMACRGDGRCQPRFPVQLSVNAIASGYYDRRGLAAALPQARIARGQCLIEAVRASCEATGRDGDQWRVEGFFLSTPAADVRAQR
jgi:hypothetical protein